MKTKSLKIGSAMVIAFFAFSTGLCAQGVDTRIGHAVIDGTPITKADAEKK
jgi:hypothetical protein